jgi:ligand-binding sensor domain-containing protein
MRFTLLTLAIVIGSAFPIAPLHAQGAFWASSGPEGALVQAIAADQTDPGVVYVGARDGGVFRYDPDAGLWTASSSGLTHLDVISLVLSPGDPAVLLAGTGGGLFRTTNRGASWTAASGPPNDNIDAIAFDPSSPSIAYAVSIGGWVGKSTDGGATWQALGGDVSTQRPWAVAVDPSSGARVFVGTIDNGVYKSENAGVSWTARNEGLENLHVAAIAVDPTNSSNLYAGTDNGGAFRSQDGGATWTDFSTGLEGDDVDAIVVDAAGRAYLGNNAGVYGALDGGLGWSILEPIDYVNALALGPGTPAPLYVGFGQLPFLQGGIGYTLDRVSFFGLSETGLNAVSVSVLAVDPFDPQHLLTAGPVSGHETLDGGLTWSSPFAFGLGASLAFDPQQPGVVYEGVTAGVFRSVDGGSQWSQASGNLPQSPLVRALLFPSGHPGRLLAGTNFGVWRTENGGDSWLAPGSELPETVYVLAASTASSAVWAGAGNGVYRSTDGGVTFTRVGSVTGSPVFAVLESAVVPKIFAGTAHALLVSADGGASFQVAGGLPVLDVRALVEDTARDVIYVGGIGGVFQSVDGGNTWTAAASGLPNPQVQSLTLLSNGTLLAGTRGGSVFRRVTATVEDRGPVEPAEGRGSTREIGPRP